MEKTGKNNSQNDEVKKVENSENISGSVAQTAIDQAERASEASFTLEPEKGITPDPDSYNGPDDDDYNLKQIGHNEKDNT